MIYQKSHEFLFPFSLPLLFQAASPSSVENCLQGWRLACRLHQADAVNHQYIFSKAIYRSANVIMFLLYRLSPTETLSSWLPRECLSSALSPVTLVLIPRCSRAGIFLALEPSCCEDWNAAALRYFSSQWQDISLQLLLARGLALESRLWRPEVDVDLLGLPVSWTGQMHSEFVQALWIPAYCLIVLSQWVTVAVFQEPLRSWSDLAEVLVLLDLTAEINRVPLISYHLLSGPHGGSGCLFQHVNILVLYNKTHGTP